MNREKEVLRRHFIAQRAAVSQEEAADILTKITDQLYRTEAWQKAGLICGYVSIKGELDLSAVANRAREEGKAYALPVTLTGKEQGAMCFRRLPNGMSHQMLPSGRYGIPEPPSTLPAITLEEWRQLHPLILVPGLAFDSLGYRIGYGGGYYDRFLEMLSHEKVVATAVGLCFSVCFIPLLPSEPHDRPLDLIIHERKVIRPHGSA